MCKLLSLINDFRKFTMCTSNNTIPSNQIFKEETTRELRIYFTMSENKGTIYQNLQDTVEAVSRGKFTDVRVKKDLKSINFHFKNLKLPL